MDEQATEKDEPLLGKLATVLCAGFAAVLTIAAFLVMPPFAAVATGLLALLMALITLIDFRHYIIPNILSYPAVPLGFLANVAVLHGDDWMAGVTESALGAVLAAGSFYLMRALWFRLRGIEGLGLGDVKLAAVAGAWLGPEPLPAACLVSALAGIAAVLVMAIIPGRRLSMNDHIPFGTFIAPVILLFWILRILQSVSIW